MSGPDLLLRAEYLLILAGCCGLAWTQRLAMDWTTFLVLFLAIDLIGTVPGVLVSSSVRPGTISTVAQRSGCSRTASENEQKITPCLASSS